MTDVHHETEPLGVHSSPTPSCSLDRQHTASPAAPADPYIDTDTINELLAKMNTVAKTHTFRCRGAVICCIMLMLKQAMEPMCTQDGIAVAKTRTC